MENIIRKGIGLRARLLRKFFYRIWKALIISKAKNYIISVQSEAKDSMSGVGPAVILCNLKCVRDLYVLMYLFREKEFSFVGLRTMEKERVFQRLISFNRIIFLDPRKKMYPFFREMLVSLRNFNRAIILSPKFELGISKELIIDPSVVVRIAMMASVPIIPVSIVWVDPQMLKCKVVMGKRFFVSPGSSEFQDVFFRRKGIRKFSKLNHDELKVVAGRIFSKLEPLDGTDIS